MKKIILYISGGAMRGIFSAGVVTYLEKINFYKNIKAIYAASAGAFAGAYFLSRQTKLGSSIYSKDLTNDFISTKDFWKAGLERIKNRFIPLKSDQKTDNTINIDYLINIIKNKKKLNVKDVFDKQIDFYIKLFNLKTKKIEYKKANEKNLIKLLKAAVKILPYVDKGEIINGNEYSDAAIVDMLGIEKIKEKHPNNKIVVIFNGPIKRNWLAFNLKNLIEGKIMEHEYGKGMLSPYLKAEKKTTKDLEKIKQDKNILLIHPPENNPTLSNTTDKDKLLKTYELGQKQARKIPNFLK